MGGALPDAAAAASADCAGRRTGDPPGEARREASQVLPGVGDAGRGLQQSPLGRRSSAVSDADAPRRGGGVDQDLARTHGVQSLHAGVSHRDLVPAHLPSVGGNQPPRSATSLRRGGGEGVVPSNPPAGPETAVNAFIDWFSAKARSRPTMIDQVVDFWSAIGWTLAMDLRLGKSFHEATKAIMEDHALFYEVMARPPKQPPAAPTQSTAQPPRRWTTQSSRPKALAAAGGERPEAQGPGRRLYSPPAPLPKEASAGSLTTPGLPGTTIVEVAPLASVVTSGALGAPGRTPAASSGAERRRKPSPRRAPAPSARDSAGPRQSPGGGARYPTRRRRGSHTGAWALLKGYGKDDAVNGVLSAFWASAARRCWFPKFVRVPSKANISDAVSRDDLRQASAEGWSWLDLPVDDILNILLRAADDLEFATDEAASALASVSSEFSVPARSGKGGAPGGCRMCPPPAPPPVFGGLDCLRARRA